MSDSRFHCHVRVDKRSISSFPRETKSFTRTISGERNRALAQCPEPLRGNRLLTLIERLWGEVTRRRGEAHRFNVYVQLVSHFLQIMMRASIASRSKYL
ncbi:Unannotated [Lentimonas sp. CC19]|nr:Unannotated [Lentimonas sp. CC10]CAA6696445.1 Unannotated [Lentimonas sp. CC19]CAA7071874.1 Unannotated [Lentimonas sp. CC11]